jgi:hypothetical protein
MRSIVRNKKGSWDGTIYIVGGMAILLFCAFIFVFGSSVLNFVMDQAVPVFDELGMVGYTNMTEVSQYTLHPVNSVIQSMTWMGTILFVFGIIAIFAIAFVYRSYAQRWLIPFFFVTMFVLVLICIFMSNMYQEFLAGTDDIAPIMAEHSGLNYFILYSPLIMSIVGFIAGAIMFGGSGQDENTA